MGNRGLEIQRVPWIECILLFFCSEFELPLEDIKEFFSFMAEIG
jgi:hypothetical protein